MIVLVIKVGKKRTEIKEKAEKMKVEVEAEVDIIIKGNIIEELVILALKKK